MNYITLLIINTCIDEYYGYIAQKWKGIILPKRSGAAHDCHASMLVAQMGGKQDLLKLLDISIYQIPTLGNTAEITPLFYGLINQERSTDAKGMGTDRT